jgi:hypothetical protein
MKRLSLSIVVASSLATGVAFGAAEPKPKVLVAVVIEAPLLRTRLADQLPVASADAAAAVRAELQTQLPYLDWVTTGPAAQQFTATIRQRPEGGDLAMIVQYAGSVGRGDPPASVLFEWWNQPPIDPAPLKEALKTRLVQDVRLRLPKLESYFATHVPLVTRVEVDSAHERVIVPVAGVIPEDESKLRVDFTRGGLPGFLLLSDATPFGSNGILCVVERFSDPPVLADRWHQRVPGVMTATDVKVRMSVFRKQAYANTTAGAANTFE